MIKSRSQPLEIRMYPRPPHKVPLPRIDAGVPEQSLHDGCTARLSRQVERGPAILQESTVEVKSLCGGRHETLSRDLVPCGSTLTPPENPYAVYGSLAKSLHGGLSSTCAPPSPCHSLPDRHGGARGELAQW